MGRAFDRFIDVRGGSDLDIVRLARSMELDIAVDLGGFTEGCRPNLFAMRAAAVQVNFLGYAGTLGTPYHDYIVADRIVIPPASQGHYSEAVVYLPDCFQPGDATRVIADRVPSRADLGLPRDGFVYCCFNNHHKITPPIFESWMRVLRQVDGSVLWMQTGSERSMRELRREAAARGIEPARVVFTGFTPLMADHLARYRAADLFLDTLPYNAHATASDALWAGLPVLTRSGESFAARVATSLLNAIGLPELVTRTAEQYEAAAIELAADTARLADLRERLRANRLTAPLFDMGRFTRHLEDAYTQMHERHESDLSPEHICVAG
jgi:predicted O-linked N-acetylglucosamine transferase (SPINDLY family)